MILKLVSSASIGRQLAPFVLEVGVFVRSFLRSRTGEDHNADLAVIANRFDVPVTWVLPRLSDLVIHKNSDEPILYHNPSSSSRHSPAAGPIPGHRTTSEALGME